MAKEIIILHSNGKVYFEAVEYLCRMNNLRLIHIETNWFKNFIKLLIRRDCPNCSFKSSLKGFLFFLFVPFIKDRTIIYGTAPYDIRFFWYRILNRKNNFIYHTSHFQWENDKKAVFKYPFIMKFLKRVWKHNLEKCKIVAVTKAAEHSLKRVFKNKRIYQIYHSINFKKFYKKRNFNNINKLKILFVGRMVYEKGLDIIVELIKILDKEKYEFTFVGDGKYRKNIEFIFNEKNVNYLGWINDKNELAKIYKNHHILLNPSIRVQGWEELFGIVNIEAMASGLVVISSNHIGPKEIIKSGKNGFLVEEKNIEQLKNILNQLYYDKYLMEKISKNAIETAKKFDIQNIAQRWKEVINA